jgi:rRNA maturation endonuclease Nob1
MRNLRQYPINATDKLVLLDELISNAEKEAANDAVAGDLTLEILAEIKRDVEFASPENRRTVRQASNDYSMRSMASQMSDEFVPR